MALDNFKKEMKRAGVTYQDVADYLGVHYQTVARWVHERSNITYRDAAAIRDRFFPELSTDVLFASSEASS